jgi:hypothetical protein
MSLWGITGFSMYEPLPQLLGLLYGQGNDKLLKKHAFEMRIELSQISFDNRTIRSV